MRDLVKCLVGGMVKNLPRDKSVWIVKALATGDDEKIFDTIASMSSKGREYPKLLASVFCKYLGEEEKDVLRRLNLCFQQYLDGEWEESNFLSKLNAVTVWADDYASVMQAKEEEGRLLWNNGHRNRLNALMSLGSF